MLKENNQLSFCLSSHASLYDILIEKDNFWRQLKDMVDFSFVYDELKDKYSSTMGRKAEDVVRMFKYLLLKNYYKLSDRDLIARTKTDMLFKYFLDYLPEDIDLIDSSLLTVFRRERLSNKENEEKTSTNLLDKLIAKTVEIALEKKLNLFHNHVVKVIICLFCFFVYSSAAPYIFMLASASSSPASRACRSSGRASSYRLCSSRATARAFCACGESPALSR